jgi:predicted aconitase with swiveling domain
MKQPARNIEASVLIAGCADGPALVLDDTLSFWGGFNPVNGEIIDIHHPQYQQLVGGRILCIPGSRGSAGTPGGIAETLRNGSGPLAFVLAERDVNISVGTLVANRLYDLEIPVLEVSLSAMKRIRSGDQLTIDRRGVISVSAQA